jgi:type III pantothenate kinase
LSLRAGLAVADLLEGVSGLPVVQLKWPNDIIVGGRKAGGLLCEARWHGAELSWVVLGLGLNVRNAPPVDVRMPAASLAQWRSDLDPAALATPVAEPWRVSAAQLCSPSAELAAWRSRDWLLDRQARLAASRASHAALPTAASCGSTRLRDREPWPRATPPWWSWPDAAYRPPGRPLGYRPMLLALDIGNTEITAGLFHGDTLVASWRLTTTADRTPDEWSAALGGFLLQRGHSPNEVRAVCYASVVPPVTGSLVRGRRAGHWDQAGGDRCPHAATGRPRRRGAGVGRRRSRGETCSRPRSAMPPTSSWWTSGRPPTFDCITADCHFIGGAIMPGLRTSADQLTRKAAKLTATELRAPQSAIARNTEDNIRAGVMFGTVDAIDGMVRRIKAEWPSGRVPKVVATGGLAVAGGPALDHHRGRRP